MKLWPRLGLFASLLTLASAGAPGCGGEEEPEQVCIPGVTQTCSCPGERVGTQTCVEDGTSFGRCLCPNPDAARPDVGAVDTARPDTLLPDTLLPDTLRLDAGAPDSGRPDSARPDSALALDRTLSSDAPRLDRALFDVALQDASGADAGAIDAATPDLGGADAARPDSALTDSARPDTLLPDTLRPDLAPGVDATPPFDAAGYAGVGEACNAVACLPSLLCTSAAGGGYYCRVRCMPDNGECDVATESCVNVTGVDGGSCVPGSAPPAACDIDDPPCADLYVCAALTTDFLCRYKCDPGAVDAGCASGPCYQITGESYGACF